MMTSLLVSVLILTQIAVLRIHDGDTFTAADGVRWRLWGVDAPELNQHCGTMPCGWLAKEHLSRLLHERGVRCEEVGKSYDRLVGKCQAGELDLSEEMVKAGWAVDYERFSGGQYSEAEALARRSHRGMWKSSHVVNPADWRKGIR